MTELRYIMRDGEKILQYRWYKQVDENCFSSTEWADVLIEKED